MKPLGTETSTAHLLRILLAVYNVFRHQSTHNSFRYGFFLHQENPNALFSLPQKPNWIFQVKREHVWGDHVNTREPTAHTHTRWWDAKLQMFGRLKCVCIECTLREHRCRCVCPHRVGTTHYSYSLFVVMVHWFQFWNLIEWKQVVNRPEFRFSSRKIGHHFSHCKSVIDYYTIIYAINMHFCGKITFQRKCHN